MRKKGFFEQDKRFFVQDLKKLKELGVEILTCGTCLNHYGLSEKLAVGSVTNMYRIAEVLSKAGKVIRP